jgi:hypothetical protein
MARAKDEIREQRIAMEAVVDAYGSSERAMGWYYYLDGKMKVPFKARCRFGRPISVLKAKEVVEVLGMAPGRGVRERNVCLGWAGRRASCCPFGTIATIVERSRDSGGRRRLALLGGSRVRAMSAAENGIQLVWS